MALSRSLNSRRLAGRDGVDAGAHGLGDERRQSRAENGQSLAHGLDTRTQHELVSSLAP